MAEPDPDPAPASTASTASTPLPAPSPFLAPPPLIGTSSCPSIIHLKRDLLIPVSFAPTTTSTTTTTTTAAPAAAERSSRPGARSADGILNTRFGDFPHDTLTNIPYGSQVRATGPGHKRKRSGAPADTGFLHILAPTPELWTASLPHRTQVVYTPDSAFVLHKLCVRPGSVVLEAGAGSGSFTHAAVRAAYGGYPDGREAPHGPSSSSGRNGRVWSYEFHKERVEKLRDEIARHGLDGLVGVVHRDVCRDGFLVGDHGSVSPGATAVFLDLPAPWLALPHLTRRMHAVPPLPTRTGLTPTPSPGPGVAETEPTTPAPETTNPAIPPALSMTEAVRICTFSPCIEQVTRTVSVLRRLGWVEVEMYEVQHRQLEVRRAQRKSYADGAGPRNVDEALRRLQWMNDYRVRRQEQDLHGEKMDAEEAAAREWGMGAGGEEAGGVVEGRLVTRGEQEVKTHTSYLVFAVLPREWSEEDERAAGETVRATTRGLGADAPVVGPGEMWKWVGEKQAPKMSKRQMKKMEKEARKAREEEEEEAKKAGGEEEEEEEGEGQGQGQLKQENDGMEIDT
ncbi:S-adenosyl-L-methionine-dependent methyltransferase [Morchella snyderi]|nr:S-adenosyl-L-methionine-dependent methyltransferase [Morchella snyderi]